MHNAGRPSQVQLGRQKCDSDVQCLRSSLRLGSKGRLECDCSATAKPVLRDASTKGRLQVDCRSTSHPRRAGAQDHIAWPTPRIDGAIHVEPHPICVDGAPVDGDARRSFWPAMTSAEDAFRHSGN